MLSVDLSYLILSIIYHRLGLGPTIKGKDMSSQNRHIVLSIAGTDPSGGAGIQADTKAISANGCYAASVITALVAQNTCGVQAIHAVPTTFITQQLESVFSDLHVSAIKIGMLHDENVIQVVAKALQTQTSPNIVLDPVMIAKNGSPLLKLEHIELLKDVLFPYVHLITPNIPEAEALLDVSITTREAMHSAAVQLGDQFGCQVLIKGGHLKEDTAPDVLFDPEQGKTQWFEASRIHTRNTHGTGCSLSSAIAAFLAKGFTMHEAIQKAKKYISLALQAGSQQTIGHGAGPIDHFYFIST
jgi:hydroxymethylpyrimidine/phosphomethylpyrimidine kinase